ncbi:hypothetical protein NHQ30_006878 [Ciborinia camelliae]|nr:hypothetical protein NHQ30_006878 [Ciborinia camelliae]
MSPKRPLIEESPRRRLTGLNLLQWIIEMLEDCQIEIIVKSALMENYQNLIGKNQSAIQEEEAEIQKREEEIRKRRERIERLESEIEHSGRKFQTMGDIIEKLKKQENTLTAIKDRGEEFQRESSEAGEEKLTEVMQEAYMKAEGLPKKKKRKVEGKEIKEEEEI